MISSKDLLALQMLDGVGDQTLRKLISNKISISELYSLNEKELRSYFTTEKGMYSFKDNFEGAQQKAEYEIEKFEDASIKMISYFDSFYPYNLSLIDDYPIFLYCIGNLELLKKDKNVAVIGTRDNSEVGQKVAKGTAYHFASKGYTIVSGLAKGIDAIAHTAALDANGDTIAVLIDVSKIYPKENYELAKRILKNNGLLIAENKPGSFQGKNAFVLRDRIQSGLSLAIFPIETDIIGGTMHTVKYAKKQSRLIFVPDVNNESLKNLYQTSVGYGFSKINGIKELIRIGDAFPYVKDTYLEVENKLALVSERLTQNNIKQDENESKKDIYSLDFPDQNTVNSNSENYIETTEVKDHTIEQNYEKVETPIVDSQTINQIVSNDPIEDNQTQNESLLIEYIKYFKKELEQYTKTDSGILENKDNIYISIEKLNKNLKKLIAPPKKKATTKKKSKDKDGEMF